jgi:preprotein translocase subunit SecG
MKKETENDLKSKPDWITKQTEERPHIMFWLIFLVTFLLGILLFLFLWQQSGIGLVQTLDAQATGGFLQGVWGTAGSLAAAFVAIVLARQALALTHKQDDDQTAQDKRTEQLQQEQQQLQRDQNRMQAQSNERERARYEFDLKRDITEQFGPLMQSNLLMGAALNTLFVESVRLNRAVSLEVERVLFSERAGLVKLIEADPCLAIARHVNADAFKTELQNVKGAMQKLYDALSVASGNPLARLAVEKQLEINDRSDVGRALLDVYAKDIPPQALSALAPVDYASFAEHIRVKGFGVTPTVRLVECWFQASLYGVREHESWLKFTPGGDIQCRLDSAGEKDGLLTYSTVVKKLLTRSESIGEGLFFLGSLIALHTESVARPESFSNAPDHETWRVNLGVLALVDFYNAIPSKEALSLAARAIYGDDSAMSADSTHPNQVYTAIIERLPYKHDAPSMRGGKNPDDILSVLPKVYSRIMVSLDQDMRSRDGEFFNLCIGPKRFTPDQNQYVKVVSIAGFRSIGIAMEIHVQVNAHYKDFVSYLAQELYGNAQQSLNLLLAEMVALLAFYDPNTHERQITALYEMHMRGAAYLEAAATNGDLEQADLIKCVGLLQDSINSVQRNEHMSPDSRSAYATSLRDAIGRIAEAAGATQS